MRSREHHLPGPFFHVVSVTNNEFFFDRKSSSSDLPEDGIKFKRTKSEETMYLSRGGSFLRFLEKKFLAIVAEKKKQKKLKV